MQALIKVKADTGMHAVYSSSRQFAYIKMD